MSPRPVYPSFDVIPDGAQRRIGMQTDVPQMPLDPRFALRAPRDDSKKQNVLPDVPSFDVIPDGPQGRDGIQ